MMATTGATTLPVARTCAARAMRVGSDSRVEVCAISPVAMEVACHVQKSFLYLSCQDCGYTEFYNSSVPGAAKFVDFRGGQAGDSAFA
jgi:hypothetical protein